MYKVRIDKFEGPFDLLVYLLENARMDIYDIRVGEITEQYIDYLKEMEELDIEVAGEFIVLAAVLIRMKSHMLLPRVSDTGEIVFEEDPRAELAGRLAEYVRTKKIAEMLQQREEYNLAVHEKPAEDMSKYIEDPDEILMASEDQMVNAFMLFLTKKKKVEEVTRRYQRVRKSKESIEQRIKYMSDTLSRKFREKKVVSFTELLPENYDRYDVTLSFMSLLSMIKSQQCDAEQTENYGEIRVTSKLGAQNTAAETGVNAEPDGVSTAAEE